MNIEKIHSRIQFFNEFLLADTTKMELNDKATYLEELSAYQAECNTMLIETKNAVLLSKALPKDEQVDLKVFSIDLQKSMFLVLELEKAILLRQRLKI